MKPYDKQAMTPAENIVIWRRRGLLIPDQDRVERYLNRIGYYRLSAYCIPFYKFDTAHEFRDSVTFDDILSLYVFDRELRLLIMDAVERVEVAVRAGISNHMSLTNGKNPFWYLENKNFRSNFDQGRLLADLERQLIEERQRLKADEERLQRRQNLTEDQRAGLLRNMRKENFLRHFLSEYNSPSLPPSWMIMEMLSWGQLSKLFAGLHRPDQKVVASNLGTHAELLESWLRSINYVRNVCAHHGRLWNRELGLTLKLPTSDSIHWLKNPVQLSYSSINYLVRLYPVLVALQSFLFKLSPSSSWADRLHTLFDHYPTVPRARMGMPENWYEDEFWQTAIQATKRGAP